MISVALLLNAECAYAKRIVIKQKKGKTNHSTGLVTYRDVAEYHDSKADFHQLTCRNPGGVGCTWKEPLDFIGEEYPVQQIIEWVKAQIDMKIVSGATRYNNKILVVWRYNADDDDLTIMMDDDPKLF